MLGSLELSPSEFGGVEKARGTIQPRVSLVAQMVKNLTAMKDLSSILGLGRSPEEGNGNPHQCSCLGNPMDRGASQATIHRVARVGHDLATKQ